MNRIRIILRLFKNTLWSGVGCLTDCWFAGRAIRLAAMPGNSVEQNRFVSAYNPPEGCFFTQRPRQDNCALDTANRLLREWLSLVPRRRCHRSVRRKSCGDIRSGHSESGALSARALRTVRLKVDPTLAGHCGYEAGARRGRMKGIWLLSSKPTRSRQARREHSRSVRPQARPELETKVEYPLA